MANLLTITGLTVRFGGLTALQDVDLTVQPGQVTAVIGPNGAGKTTLFNVISGIYGATAGHLEFKGKPLRRRRSRWLWASWFAVGVATGVAAMVLAANVDRLWVVAIKQHYQPQRGFFWQESLSDLRGYWRGEPRLEHRMGRWFVMSHDGTTFYGSRRSRSEAEARLSSIRDEALAGAAAYRRRHGVMLLLGSVVGIAAAAATWQQTRRTPGWVARQGIARTFQNNRVFKNMTVLQNLQVAQDARQLAGRWPMGLPWPGSRRRRQRLLEQANDLLTFVGLSGQEQRLAAELSYGDQRRLEIARALATSPRLVLLDEPAAGMNPTETRALLPLIGAIAAQGIAVLLIEHDIHLVMAVSERVVVLEYGSKIAEGTPAEVRANAAVIAAYLGQGDA